jgi:hypothetical protein
MRLKFGLKQKISFLNQRFEFILQKNNKRIEFKKSNRHKNLITETFSNVDAIYTLSKKRQAAKA